MTIPKYNLRLRYQKTDVGSYDLRVVKVTMCYTRKVVWAAVTVGPNDGARLSVIVALCLN